jgi:hypothetical protein
MVKSIERQSIDDHAYLHESIAREFEARRKSEAKRRRISEYENL